MKKFKPLLFFLTLFIFSACTDEKKIKLIPDPNLGKFRDYVVGVLFLEGFRENLKKTVYQEVEALSNVKLLKESQTYAILEIRSISLNSLVRASNIIDLPDLEGFDQLSLFYYRNNRIYLKSLNFLQKTVRDLEVTETILSGKNWLLNSRSGWLFVNSSPTNLEVYINKKHMGFTPVLFNLKDGLYTVFIANHGEAVYWNDVNIPFSNAIYYRLQNASSLSIDRGQLNGGKNNIAYKR